MPHFILALGLLACAYAIYRFLLKANKEQVAGLIGTLAILCFSIGMIFLAATGRLHAIIAAFGAIYPWVLRAYKWHKSKKLNIDDGMSTKEALEILDLDETASEEDIENKYKHLMKQNHPDHKGSRYFAQKLNQARDILLKKQPSQK